MACGYCTKAHPQFKPKDMVPIPWMVAMALQADGWYLRSDIIWHKPNPMPESVTDRPTKSHEYLFLLAKSPKYYYDAESIKEAAATEPHAPGCRPRDLANFQERKNGDGTSCSQWTEESQSRIWGNGIRNRRTVWTIPTEAYPEANFATFPTALVEPCILAGCPEGGTVLEPFCGSGTTLAVAVEHGRGGIGIELNSKYIPMATKRIDAAFDAFSLIDPTPPATLRQAELFSGETT